MRDPSIPTHSVPIEKITVLAQRGRQDFNRVQELAASIKKDGLINPIMVSRENGGYILIAGERRMRAYQLLYMESTPQEREKWMTIDVRIREELSPLQMKEIELNENICRSDLNELERCKLVTQIHDLKVEIHGSVRGDKDNWTLQKTAELTGYGSKGRVANMVRIGRAVANDPSLAKTFKGKPENAILRELDRNEERARLSRLQESGQLVIDHSLIHGDCRTELSKLPDASIHAFVTDPPFGIPRLTEMEGDNRDETMSYLADMKPADNLNLDDARNLMFSIIPEMERVLVTGGHFYIFTCYELYPSLVTILKLREKLDFDPVLLTWDKGETTAAFMGYRYAPCSELILFGWKRDPSHPKGYGRKLNGPCSSLLRYKPLALKQHPFEKPPALLEFLISQSTHPGERVGDPFAGSGRTLQAARKLGRSAWGCELEKDHWTLAQGLLAKKEI